MYPGTINFFHILAVIPREVSQPGAGAWTTWVFIICLSLLSITRYFFPGRIRQIATAAWSIRHFNILHKETNITGDTPGILLKLNFILVLSLLIYQSIEYAELLPEIAMISPARFYTIIFFLIVVFYPAKNLILRVLAWVFQTRTASTAYFGNIVVVNQFAGLALMPLVFIHAYNPNSYLVYSAWLVFALLNLYKVFRGALLGFHTAGFSMYYLFLYLCGVELAPLLLILKAASEYLFNN